MITQTWPAHAYWHFEPHCRVIQVFVFVHRLLERRILTTWTVISIHRLYGIYDLRYMKENRHDDDINRIIDLMTCGYYGWPITYCSQLRSKFRDLAVRRLFLKKTCKNFRIAHHVNRQFMIVKLTVKGRFVKHTLSKPSIAICFFIRHAVHKLWTTLKATQPSLIYYTNYRGKQQKEHPQG